MTALRLILGVLASWRSCPSVFARAAKAVNPPTEHGPTYEKDDSAEGLLNVRSLGRAGAQNRRGACNRNAEDRENRPDG
jgi:hypothetical protein